MCGDVCISRFRDDHHVVIESIPWKSRIQKKKLANGDGKKWVFWSEKHKRKGDDCLCVSFDTRLDDDAVGNFVEKRSECVVKGRYLENRKIEKRKKQKKNSYLMSSKRKHDKDATRAIIAA